MASLIVSRTRLSTIGDRAFPVAAARVWNSLPDRVTSAPSVAVFRSRLKTHLFNISYPFPLWLYSACAVTLSYFGHFNRSCLLTYLLTYLLAVTHTFNFNFTCHMTQVNSPALTPARQAGRPTRFTYPCRVSCVLSNYSYHKKNEYIIVYNSII